MKVMLKKKLALGALASIAALVATAGSAWAAATDPLNSGDTAWMLTSSALVLLMTIPGLALFYAGMVRKKNVLATLAQSFGATCVITVLWMADRLFDRLHTQYRRQLEPDHRRLRLCLLEADGLLILRSR